MCVLRSYAQVRKPEDHRCLSFSLSCISVVSLFHYFLQDFVLFPSILDSSFSCIWYPLLTIRLLSFCAQISEIHRFLGTLAFTCLLVKQDPYLFVFTVAEPSQARLQRVYLSLRGRTILKPRKLRPD